MNYHIITFGCQMNKSDSERIAAVLEKMKMKHSSILTGADLVVINMCSVRQMAVDKVKNKIAHIKHVNNKAKIVLTGCILKKDKEVFSQRVDLILDIKSLPSWPKLLSFQTTPRRIQRISYLKKVQPIRGDKKMAYVPISFGCNNFCSYCVVPYTRGREKHRAKKEIIQEIKTLIKQGYKKIILLGENVNNYPNFTNLLRDITAQKGDFVITFIAANPQNFTDELIDEVANNAKIEKYIHLPLQSGDNAILKKMKRPYTRGQYLKLAQKIIKKIPNVKISVDVIVGFPGETEKQFQNTADVLRKLGRNLHQAYIAKYSPRANTAAFYMKDTVPESKKAQREQKLRKIISSS